MSGEASTGSGTEVRGAIVGENAPRQTHPVLVAPTNSTGRNTIRAAIIPIACWRLEDIRFGFDSSFINPEVAAEMKLLATLVKEHPGAPASVFGHADPVGNDDYNKKLSGRRAAAIYGMLTRNTDIWEDIYSQTGKFTPPLSSDDWGLRSIQIMLATLGYSPGDIDGDMGRQTREAVKNFQRDHQPPLSDDGDPGPRTRAKLFLEYMNKNYRDENGEPFVMATTDFLAQGVDIAGKGDYQGCSEFNPLLLFSQEENETFQRSADRTERNAANAPNRRVMVLLFRPGSQVNAERWPCPRAKEGVAGCKKRFFSDSERRRSFQEERRQFEDTKDTFACRFYQRITGDSPCERISPPPRLEEFRFSM